MPRRIFRRCLISTHVSPVRKKRLSDPFDETQNRARIETARQFAIDAARLASQTHCHGVTVLDVSAISPVTDFFVIATGTSQRQMRTVCDEIEELGGPRDFRSISKPGYEGSHWILVDFVDVVVHVFDQEARAFYDLDNLWGDGKPVEWSAAK
jgi:ribosome-associated protein